MAHPEQRTHLATSSRLCGEVRQLGPGTARVALAATPEMAVDDRRLVHGGFVFGLADYAAMLAVNDPNVVLGAAEVRFLKPVRVGEEVLAEASAPSAGGRRQEVEVTVKRGDEVVFSGRFTCFVLDHHVLD